MNHEAYDDFSSLKNTGSDVKNTEISVKEMVRRFSQDPQLEQLGNLLPLCKNSAGNRIKIKF